MEINKVGYYRWVSYYMEYRWIKGLSVFAGDTRDDILRLSKMLGQVLINEENMFLTYA